MVPSLSAALGEIGVDCPVLAGQSRYTREILEDVGASLSSALDSEDGSGLDVVVLGSLAREEASRQADLDYLIVVHELPREVRSTQRLLAAMENEIRRVDMRGPGTTGIFGRVVAAADLAERIGLEDDTNRTQTHRMLLLQESRSIFRPVAHAALLRRIVERYLVDYDPPKRGVPRFLLNDVIRYWRTITVDYQAKRWRDHERGWGLRFLKLRISRKLAFAGTLTSLLLTEDASPDYFVDQFSMPPLARLAQLASVLQSEGRERLLECFAIADRFAERLSEPKFRAAVSSVPNRQELEQGWPALMEDTRRLQANLESIFFGDPRLQRVAIRYLSF